MEARVTRLAATPLLDAIRRLERIRPLYVVGAFVVVEWVAVLGIALTVKHNGWLWYQGGDQVWFYTTSSQLLHGHLPVTAAGYGWSILLLPIAAICGPNLLHALPAIVLLNMLVLMPAAMGALYGIGRRLGGRLAGYWILAVWVATPLIGIVYTNTGYHQKYSEISLPQSLGLTAMSDFPSMVMLAISAYFAVRTLQGGGWADCALAGLFGGFAIGIKPASGLYLGGLVLALAATRNRRAAAYVAGGLALPLLTLLLWKARGLGHVPLLQSSTPAFRAAAGRTPPLALGLHTGKYLHLNWSHLTENVDLLRQHFWSGRLLVFFVIAGIIALWRLRPAVALLVGGWFLAFAFVKGMDPSATIQDGSLLRLMIGSIPAWVLLLATLPLLVPGALRRVPRPEPPQAWGTPRLRLTAVIAALVLFALVPVGFAATTRPVLGTTGSTFTNTASLFNEEAGPIPVESALRLKALVHGRRISLFWQSQGKASASYVYEVVRTPIATSNRLFALTYSRTWIVGTATRFVQVVPQAERDDYYYRVLEVASWSGDPVQGDGYVASNPVLFRLLPKGTQSPAACGVLPDEEHDWETVVGTATVRVNAVTVGARVGQLVPGVPLNIEVTSCTNYKVVAEFPTKQQARAFAQQLVAAGYTRTWHVVPYVERS
jgi:hypothetical protein